MKRCLGCMELFEDDFEICPHCGYVEGTEAEEAIHMEPGTILADRYVIGKVLGYGGFGVTYIGWDGKLEQKVAIKEYLPSEFSTRMPGQSRVTVFNGDKNEQFYDGLKKFVEEAKRLAKFQNEPGIVKVFDSFIENDTAYIIMEYLDGETLTTRLKRDGKIPEDEAVGMVIPIMESLKVVHEEGILHRDIAPDNIFITKSGDIKLIDFGASRYATTSHSRSLTVIIKPGYSPEEQYRSAGDQGPWTDVYALGACLYKMITGKTPPDAMERRAKFESQNKDILETPRKLTKKLSTVRENAILNAMNVRIEDRTPDVQSLISELMSDTPIKRKNGKIKKLNIYGWPIWFKVVAAIILIGIFSLSTLMAAGVIRVDSLFSTEIDIPAGMVQIPLVEGMKDSKAKDTLEKNNLQMIIDGSFNSQYVSAGKIVLQKPASGMFCEKDSVVKLYMSDGNGEVAAAENGKATVPNLIAKTEDEAVERLATAGLGVPEIIYEYNESYSLGLVFKQSKAAASTVDEGTVLTITISKGSKPFEMPNVVNMTYVEAQKKLSALGLVVEKETKETGAKAEGVVVSQSEATGKTLQKGNTVILSVAKAPQWVSCTTLPVEVTSNQGAYDIETFYQYRSRSKVSVSDASQAGSDWTLITSEKYDTGNYTEFTDWSPGNNTGDDVQSRTKYKYRLLETKWDSSPSLNGWTATGNVQYSDWGAEQASDSKPADSNTCMNIRSVTHYSYQHWDCKTYYRGPDLPWWCYGSNVNGAGVQHTHTQDTPLYDNGQYCEGPGCQYGFYSWWLSGTSTTYYYQTRSITSYEYTHKSGWKESDSAPGEANAIDVSSVTEYRSRNKIYGTTYTYWGSFSAWSDNYMTSSDNMQVESGVKSYRYKLK